MTLIGRHDDLTELGRLLDLHRLITVLGPGGVGKTAIARALVADRDHLFVELSSLSGADDLTESVAGRHGFSSPQGLLAWLADRGAGDGYVVVLDTCEHVLDGAAELAGEIGRVGPGVAVVATSRMPLDLPGERVHLLRPLALPGPDDPHDAPAVELFLARSAAAGATHVDPEAAARLCVRLDGMPLAIELAAARSRAMSPDEIVVHLDARAEVLTRSGFRGEARHRSMRAAIEWSYELLPTGDQHRLRALAVLPGWFDPELAAALWAAEPRAGPASFEVHDHLADLVDRSLVVAETDGADTRFRLLDTIRAYARRQADEHGELDRVTDRYVTAVTDRAQGYLAASDQDWDGATLRSLLAVADDLLHACRLALADAGPERPYVLMTLLWAVVHQGRSAEIAQLGKQVIDAWPDDAHPLWADAATTTATALREQGDLIGARSLVERALTRIDGALFAEITANRLVALIWQSEDPAKALTSGEVAATAAERLGLPPFVHEMRVVQAQALFGLDRSDEALALTREVLSATAPTDVNNIWARIVEGMVLVERDPAVGIATLERAAEASVANGYPFGIGACGRLLALAELRQGEHQRSAERLLASIAHNLDHGNVGELGVTILASAALLEAAGAPEGAELAQSATAWPSRSGTSTPALEELRLADANLGRGVPPRESIVRARTALTRLARRPGPGPEPEPQPEPETGSGPGGGGVDEGPVGRGGHRAVLVRDGDHWRAGFDGRTVTIRHGKGLADLAALIARQGREVHVLDLTGAGVVEAAADVVLDDDAVAAYRQRVIELEDDLAGAEADADPIRAERARVELDHLVDQLSAAYGSGGRRRRTTGSAERARSAVTQRIRSTIKRLTELHPALGRHLAASVSTGLYCAYRPERTVDWEL